MPSLFHKHQELLQKAVETCRIRDYWSPFQESPRASLHPPGKKQAGKKQFETLLGNPFPLSQPGEIGKVGIEVSPYTQRELGIRYPAIDIDVVMQAAQRARNHWTQCSVEERIGVCMELISQLDQNSFVNTYASMHTAGMSFMMGFAGSGANALDRGLEAIAHAYRAMQEIPSSSRFQRSFGRGEPTKINKNYRLQSRGVAVVICCGTFPTWNAYPSLFANLATGNAVVVKPHPNGILPMAIAVQTCRKTLAALGFDPNLVTLAADESSKPITHRLLNHPLTKIIDFTGNPSFGAWLEENHYRKLIYTETAGCNSVVIESTPNYSGMIQAIAQSLALFSSQMCTSAQNIFIPKTGITSSGKHISFQEIVDDLVKAVDQMVAEPKAAAALCGAVMSKRTIFEVNSLREKAHIHGRLYRDSKPYPHPDFPRAQTATPLIVGLDIDQSFLYRKEHFGPMSFIIASNSAEQALQQAAKDAQECGSISCYAYSQSPAFQDQIEETFFQAGSSIGINLIRHRPINFAAAYSDFHVTGLNPAGNACLTDISFVASRFRIVQSKREQLQS